MRRILISLVILASLGTGVWQFVTTPSHPTDNPTADKSLPLDWPPRAEDGRTESFFSALALYFKTLFSADEIVKEAHEVADKAAQRQQEIDQAVDNKR